MKTPRFNISVVTALAVGTLILICSADARPKNTLAHYGRRAQDSSTASEPRTRVAGKVKHPPNEKVLARRVPTSPDYPRYQLVELGTLGGPNSSQVFPGVTLNNRGEVIAQASTDTLDPYPFTIADEFIWHGILSNANGIVRDLGALPGVNQSLPVWISNNGFIVGMSGNGLLDPLTDFPQLRPVLWDRDRNIHDLGTFGGNTGWATAVNNRGQVAGYATNTNPEDPDVGSFMNGFLPAGQQVRAFLWNGGSLRDLGTLGGNDAAAQAINENGEVAGLSYTNTGINETTGLPTVHPFVWRNGTMQDLGSLGGTLAMPGSFSFGPFAKFFNEHGDVAGTSMLPGDEDYHAFVWTNGRMIDLGTLGGNLSEAFAINDAGQVVGLARTTNMPRSYHPFLWEKGQMIDLGVAAPCTRGGALTINSRGEIAGGFGGCGPDPGDRTFNRGFLWQKGKPIVDVNTLITPGSEIWVDEISFINDTGMMVGAGILPDGSSRAVLLVPTHPGR
jgi:probable HAF family extracellular repeat protein